MQQTCVGLSVPTQRRAGRQMDWCLQACEPVVTSHLLLVCRSYSASRRAPSRGRVLLPPSPPLASLTVLTVWQNRGGIERERKMESDGVTEESERGWGGDQVRGFVVNVFLYSMFTSEDNVCILSLWPRVGGSFWEGQVFSKRESVCVCVERGSVCAHLVRQCQTAVPSTVIVWHERS